MTRTFPYMVLLTSLSLAATAAYYSVFGLSKLFSAQAYAVIIMASILESAKLITASYLHRFWKQISVLMKIYLTSAVVVLMLITSLGIYGFLVSAYQETAYELENVQQEVGILQLKQDRFREQLTDIQDENASLNKNISELTIGLSNNVIQYTNGDGQLITTTSSSTRTALQEQLQESKTRRDILAIKEIALMDSVSSIDIKMLKLQTESDAAAEIGPLKYVAKQSGRDTDSVVNWFILLFIFVFDPLAIVLLVGATHAFKNSRPKHNTDVEIKQDLKLDTITDQISEQVTQKKINIEQVPNQNDIERKTAVKNEIEVPAHIHNKKRKILKSE